MNPFGTVKHLRRKLGFDSSRNSGPKEFDWTDTIQTLGVFKGQSFEIRESQRMAQGMLERTEEQVFKPPEQLGVTTLVYDHSQDVLDGTKMGCSVWNDENNHQIAEVRNSLIPAFICHI
jgi:hypothetical protein